MAFNAKLSSSPQSYFSFYSRMLINALVDFFSGRFPEHHHATEGRSRGIMPTPSTCAPSLAGAALRF